MLRPVSARWFEVLCPRSESIRTVSALAETGAVEIELREHRATDLPMRHLQSGLRRYDRLLSRYGRYWSSDHPQSSPMMATPDLILARTLARIEAWAGQADPVIERLQQLEDERNRLSVLQRLFYHLQFSPIDFGLINGCGPFLDVFCAILPGDADLQLPDSVLYRSLSWEGEYCVMLVVPQEAGEAARQSIKSVRGRILARPEWLRGDAREARRLVAERLQALHLGIEDASRELDTLYDDFTLDEVLADVANLRWFRDQVTGLELAGRRFVWITGWTSDLDGERLLRALEQAGGRALLRFVPAPALARIPQLLENPRWLRPFELFARALGIPDHDEADPTPLLALIAPLLFGYMFGDVGQGAVLLAVGWLLKERWPIARLLIAAGFSAILFGFLFGSLFAREDVIPALWLHPMQAPLTMLLVPLAFGVSILSLGQLLEALSAAWRKGLAGWLWSDAGFLLMYLGLAALLITPSAAWMVMVGLAWYLLGFALWHRRPLALLTALGQLLEKGSRILVNTLSFARVGAFALAHAGLSVAVTSLADSAGSTELGILVMVLGNLLIILLEGIVVSVQTGRLILFEFFSRFLSGQGRVFQPLPVPPVMVRGDA